MIDYKKEIVAILLPLGLKVYNENFLKSDTQIPCISYQEVNNTATLQGDTLGYSDLYFNIKIWGKDTQTLMEYGKQIDDAMRVKGFKRLGTSELWLDGIGQLQLRYVALAKEQFKMEVI